MLHVLGYDHEVRDRQRVMRQKEEEALAAAWLYPLDALLRGSFGYAVEGRGRHVRTHAQLLAASRLAAAVWPSSLLRFAFAGAVAAPSKVADRRR